jgi:uncharacterized protein YccT (UPF0319 family)
MRTTIIAFMATLFISVSSFAAQNSTAVTVNFPEAESMDSVIQDVSGYLAMQGSSIKLDKSGKTLEGKRVDGIRFEVLFKSENQHATVQCRNRKSTLSNSPSLKHKHTGRRFKKSNQKKIDACTQSLALSVRRALR